MIGRLKIFLLAAAILAVTIYAFQSGVAEAKADRQLITIKKEIYKALIVTGDSPSVRVIFTNTNRFEPVIFQIADSEVIGIAGEESKYLDLEGNKVYQVAFKSNTNVGVSVRVEISNGYLHEGW